MTDNRIFKCKDTVWNKIPDTDCILFCRSVCVTASAARAARKASSQPGYSPVATAADIHAPKAVDSGLLYWVTGVPRIPARDGARDGHFVRPPLKTMDEGTGRYRAMHSILTFIS